MQNLKIKKVKDVRIVDLPAFNMLYSSNRNQGGHRKYYNKEICAFDIETSVVPGIQQAVMYIWQFAIEDTVYIGRTWDEFKYFIKLLKAVTGGRTTVVFVHNLSYEIQFLSGIFHFENDCIFPTEPRHVLRANIDNIEFRCSYRLTNLSLDAFTSRYDVEHKKLHDFDYDKVRYPWTEISDTELSYCVNDVLGLVEAVHALMQLHGDDLYTFPPNESC